MPVFQDLTGQTFSRLTVIDRAKNGNSGKVRWNCICECGSISIVTANGLKRGRTNSCGCLRKELLSKRKTTHGMKHSPEYQSWSCMKTRCLNKSRNNYKDYGGRGITVCDRWLNSFENFYADMGLRPSLAYSIDRIDNDGNYEPDNCHWATNVEQARNQRVRKDSKSGISGVLQRPCGSWVSCIRVNGKRVHLYFGRHLETACRLRLEAEDKYWATAPTQDLR